MCSPNNCPTPTSSCLAVDIGNTLQKAAVFGEHGEILRFLCKSRLERADIAGLCKEFGVRRSIVSNVGAQNADIESFLKENTDFLAFSHTTPLPIRIAYATPQTLGLDRIANAVAAHAAFPGEDVLAIQAGTCIVLDFVTREGVFRGGSISPGIAMRFAALHHFTRRLPIVETRATRSFIGQSTEESMVSGVMNGVGDEINGAIARYEREFGEVRVVLTGGDKNDLQESIKKPIFAKSDFVLQGLYNILIFNAKKE